MASFLFLSIFASIFNRAAMANSKSFQNLITKTPFSLVLFQTNKCGACKRILSILDQITDKYADYITMMMIDTEISKDIASKYSVTEIPSIGVFGAGKFIRYYKGAWTERSICEFCDSLLSQKVDYINDIFDFYNFQKTKLPANLIIADQEKTELGNSLLRSFAGILSVGVLKNKTLASILGFDVAQISRPSDGFIQNVGNLDFSFLESLANPLLTRIENQETFGTNSNPSTTHSLVAFIDERDPLQIFDIQNLVHNLSSIYGENLSYQYCDFYRCTTVARQLGIVNYGNPLFVLSSKTEAKQGLHLYADPSPTSDEMRGWLDEHVLGIKPTSSKLIPELMARNFMRVALDPNIDVILLITIPGMHKAKEGQENFLNLIEIFRPFKKIQFYEFNPKAQQVPGLQIPKSDKPTISVWPSGGASSGASFPATGMPFTALVENVMKFVKTKISPAHIRDIAAKAEALQNDIEAARKK